MPSDTLVTSVANRRSSAVMSPERAAAMKAVRSSRCTAGLAGARRSLALVAEFDGDEDATGRILDALGRGIRGGAYG